MKNKNEQATNLLKKSKCICPRQRVLWREFNYEFCSGGLTLNTKKLNKIITVKLILTQKGDKHSRKKTANAYIN